MTVTESVEGRRVRAASNIAVLLFALSHGMAVLVIVAAAVQQRRGRTRWAGASGARKRAMAEGRRRASGRLQVSTHRHREWHGSEQRGEDNDQTQAGNANHSVPQRTAPASATVDQCGHSPRLGRLNSNHRHCLVRPPSIISASASEHTRLLMCHARLAEAERKRRFLPRRSDGGCSSAWLPCDARPWC